MPKSALKCSFYFHENAASMHLSKKLSKNTLFGGFNLFIQTLVHSKQIQKDVKLNKISHCFVPVLVLKSWSEFYSISGWYLWL